MITKLLAVTAIGVGVAVGQGPSQALVADPAFNDLSCTCQTPPPVPGQTTEDRINQGLQDALNR